MFRAQVESGKLHVITSKCLLDIELVVVKI